MCFTAGSVTQVLIVLTALPICRLRSLQLDKAAPNAANLPASHGKHVAGAAEYTAGYGKLLIDSAGQPAQQAAVAAVLEVQPGPSTTDADLLKAGYGKLLDGTAEQQAQHAIVAAVLEAQPGPPTAYAAQLKAGYGKLLDGTAEQQAQQACAAGATANTPVATSTANAAELKAGYNKLLVNSAEQQAQHVVVAAVLHSRYRPQCKLWMQVLLNDAHQNLAGILRLKALALAASTAA